MNYEWQEPADKNIDLKKLKSAFVRGAKTFWISFGIAAVLSVSAVVFIPASYLSKSTILIEQQEIPQDLVRSTVTSYADQRIEIISQRVMSSANLWQIIEKYKLYQEDLKKETREYVIHEMRENGISRNLISADVVDPRSGAPTKATIAFQLSFEYENPHLAQKVANELTSLFLSENLKSRTQMAEQASSFLAREAERLEQRVKELEAALAVFKERHFEALPELTKLNLSLLDRTEQALLDNRRQLSLVSERISFLRSELAQIDPMAPYIDADGTRVLSNAARLKLVNQELDQQASRYSESHPDVIRLTSELESLLEEVDDSAAPDIKLEIYQRRYQQLLSRYSREHPSVVSLENRLSKLENLVSEKGSTSNRLGADNPVYIQINAQLEASLIEKKGLAEQEAVLQKELNKYEQRLTDAPKIEQQYQQLNRDYQSTVLKYAEVKAKQEEATLGQSLESEQKGEKFTLIEPPLVPEEAHSPNRKMLAVLALIFTVGVSIGLLALREALDSSIKSRTDLIKAVGSPPLAVVPFIPTSTQIASRRKTRLIVFALAFVAMIVTLGIFHVYIKPLDVTWFIAMRKFGLM